MVKKYSFFAIGLTLAITLGNLSVMPSNAQGWTDSGAQGNLGNITDTTWQNVQQVPTPGRMNAPVGQTLTTGSQGNTDLSNSVNLPQTTTGGMAEQSVNNAGFGFNGFNAFTGGGAKPYVGPYASGGPNGNQGGSLPGTSLGSCLNIETTAENGK